MLSGVQIAADVLKLDGLDDPGLKEGPNEGVYIHGLFLEGCAWSKKENKLVDSAPKQLFAALPIMFVTAVLSAETKGGKNNYSCPVYKNKKRGIPTRNTILPRAQISVQKRSICTHHWYPSMRTCAHKHGQIHAHIQVCSTLSLRCRSVLRRHRCAGCCAVWHCSLQRTELAPKKRCCVLQGRACAPPVQPVGAQPLLSGCGTHMLSWTATVGQLCAAATSGVRRLTPMCRSAQRRVYSSSC